MNYNFTAEIIRDKETDQYIGLVPGLPGAHTQAPTLDELNHNLQEVIQLCLQEITDEEKKQLPYHGNQDIARPLTRQILREINITPEEFNNLLKKL